MSKKQLLKESVVREDRATKDGNEYVYTLLVRESTKVASYKIPLYSISVEMTDAEGNKTAAQIGDIFSDIGKALVFYDKLRENLATPLNLPYILEDEIGN